jgi:predicted PurR-regulated permease PerM
VSDALRHPDPSPALPSGGSSRPPRLVRVRLTTPTVLAACAAVALGLALTAVLDDARRSLGWFFAAAVVAVLIDAPVAWLSRWMRRGFAVLLVFLAVGTGVGWVGYGVFHDLSSELDKLQREIPEAARRLEESEQFGELARDLELVQRAEDAVDGLGERLSGQARATAASFGAYFAGTVLVLFLLAWLPRYVDGGLSLVSDPARRARAKVVVEATLRTGRTYLLNAIAVAIASGVAGFSVARAADLPAPVPLGLFVAILSLVPYFGVMVGAVPLVVLAAGLESSARAVAVLVALFVVQVLAALAMRRVQQRTLYVGPGITLVVGLLGYAAYNIGGALFGVAAAVFALALLDAIATDEPAATELDALTIV